MDTRNPHERFKFFENYQEPTNPKRFAMTPPRDLRPEADEPAEEDHLPPSDPNIVRACDHEEEVIVTDTAKKMLNKFRELETMAERGETLPQGPKPLKRITPPREYTVDSDGHDSSPEPERDPNVIRASDKIEDVLLIQADKARNLRQKFENWSNEDDDYYKAYEEDDGQPSIDTAKNLKAKFEALREETQRSSEKPKYKVNRFVDKASVEYEKCSICQKILYAMEKIEANNQRVHKKCFRCCQCSSPLRLDNFTAIDGTFYCLPHFKQLFISRGNYDEGFGRKQHKEKWTNGQPTTPTTINDDNGEYEEATHQEMYA